MVRTVIYDPIDDNSFSVGPRGSRMYKAPEQGTMLKPTPYDAKVDVFSFGISAAEVTKQGEYHVSYLASLLRLI